MALVGRVLTVECPCAGTPHEVDTVEFRKALSIAGGMEAIAAISRTQEDGEVTQLTLAVHIFPVFLKHAVESWSFLREDGTPLPIEEGDALLSFWTKYQIADAADDLFGEEITRPFLPRTDGSSRSSQTGPSTSANRAMRRSRRKPSGSSSPDTSEASGQ